jgi:hypothetical protein
MKRENKKKKNKQGRRGKVEGEMRLNELGAGASPRRL